MIYLLIGQKGSGKTFLGGLLEKKFGIRFIRVEDWAKQIKKERAVENESYLNDVFDQIEKGIRQCMQEADSIVFESTGLTGYFDQMLERLKKDFTVRTVGIYAEQDVCLDRVRSRDPSMHINISDDQVDYINQQVRQRNFPTDYSIVNQHKTEAELIHELAKIVGRRG